MKKTLKALPLVPLCFTGREERGQQSGGKLVSRMSRGIMASPNFAPHGVNYVLMVCALARWLITCDYPSQIQSSQCYSLSLPTELIDIYIFIFIYLLYTSKFRTQNPWLLSSFGKGSGPPMIGHVRERQESTT